MTRDAAKRLWQESLERKRQKFIRDMTRMAEIHNPGAYSTKSGRQEWAIYIEKTAVICIV